MNCFAMIYQYKPTHIFYSPFDDQSNLFSAMGHPIFSFCGGK